MEYIRVTNDNLENEHICCAISNNKDVQVASKKAWLKDRLDAEQGSAFSRLRKSVRFFPTRSIWHIRVSGLPMNPRQASI